MICNFCKKEIKAGEYYEKIKNAAYHGYCANLKKQKTHLTDYICKLYQFKQPGPLIEKQMKSMFATGYSYLGMEKALRYFYEVKNNPVDFNRRTIGIIPYVYEEAQTYYVNLHKQQMDMKESLNTQYTTNAHKQISVKNDTSPRSKTKYNVEEWDTLDS